MLLYKIEDGTCKAISNYPLQWGIYIVEITEISNDAAKFKFFKMKIVKSDIETVGSIGFLPEGVGIKFRRDTNKHINNNKDRFNRY